MYWIQYSEGELSINTDVWVNCGGKGSIESVMEDSSFSMILNSGCRIRHEMSWRSGNGNGGGNSDILDLPHNTSPDNDDDEDTYGHLVWFADKESKQNGDLEDGKGKVKWIVEMKYVSWWREENWP